MDLHLSDSIITVMVSGGLTLAIFIFRSLWKIDMRLVNFSARLRVIERDMGLINDRDGQHELDFNPAE